MKYLYSRFLLVAIMAGFFVISCTKESDVLQPGSSSHVTDLPPSVAEMREWYNSANVGGKPQRKLSINWSKPDTIANGAAPLSCLPIEVTRVEFTSQYQGYRRLVVGRVAGTQQLQGVIIEVVHKGTVLSLSQVNQAFRKVYRDYTAGSHQLLGLAVGFNGFAAVYSKQNGYLTGRSFTNGIPSAMPDWLEFLPGEKNAGRGMDVDISCVRSITHYTTSGDDVITWTCTVSGVGGGTGSTGGNGSGNTGGSGSGSTGGNTGGGSGGGGGHGPIPDEPYDDGSGWGGTTNPTQTARIINHLPPCLNQAYVSLLGAIALHASQTSAAGFPSSFLPISYFTGPSHDWELHAGPLPTDHLGQTHIDASNQVITVLDDQQLRNATDLTVMALIMHESVHAYLVAYYANDPIRSGMEYPDLVEAMLRQSPSQQNNTQHNQLVTDFKNEIGQILYTYCTQLGYNVSLQYCQDLAWNGLDRTAAWQALSQSEKNRIAAAINRELSGVNALGLKPSGC